MLVQGRRVHVDKRVPRSESQQCRPHHQHRRSSGRVSFLGGALIIVRLTHALCFASRQLISPGRSAGFVIFEDTPSSFDAWEIDLPHLETATQLEAESVKVHQAGPIRASVVCQYRHGESTWSVGGDPQPLRPVTDSSYRQQSPLMP